MRATTAIIVALGLAVFLPGLAWGIWFDPDKTEFRYAVRGDDGKPGFMPMTLRLDYVGVKFQPEVDVQAVVNDLLGNPCGYTTDVDNDCAITAIDLQAVINAALGIPAPAQGTL